MKTCKTCGIGIGHWDGYNKCDKCHSLGILTMEHSEIVLNAKAKSVFEKQRIEREKALASLGLKKVTDKMGGIYWE